MSTFKDRLEVEQKDLQEKTEKLLSFIGSENFQKVDDSQKTLLSAQSGIMQAYNIILKERIRLLS